MSSASYTSPGKNEPNESAAQSSRCELSNSPRVAGESNIGGRTAVQRAVADVERLAGVDPAHPLERQLDVAEQPRDDREVAHERRVAGTARARASRLPMWSWSSCERKIQRTSSGSTTENACAASTRRATERARRCRR